MRFVIFSRMAFVGVTGAADFPDPKPIVDSVTPSFARASSFGSLSAACFCAVSSACAVALASTMQAKRGA